MALLEGTFYGKAVPGTAKVGNAKGKILAVVTLEVTEGEHKGKRFNYEGKLDADNIKYTKRDMIAVGWKGQKSSTLTGDVDAAGLVVPFEVEIARWTNPEGKLREWNAVRGIGRGGTREVEALDADKQRSVDQWFAEAGDVAAPAPANGTSGGGQTRDQSDIPF